MPYPLGVVAIAFGAVPAADAARRAAELGFDHVDVFADADTQGGGEDLALPVGDRVDLSPRPGWTAPAAPGGEGAWERTAAAFRRCPTARMEPWVGSVVGSVEACRAMLDEVPGLRLTVDTGHVAAWGEDPVELLPWADHVQLRQARKGENQTLEGDVDFGRVLDRLRALDYGGLLSVEYFDLPDMGWPLDDPVAYAVALAEQVRPLL